MRKSKAYRRRLIVMVKEPRPGRVKTRLGRDMSMVGAAWWFRWQVASVLQKVQDPRWETILAVSPDRAGLESRVWPDGIPRVPQGHGDLGDRMGRIFRSGFKGPVCIIGADIPGVSATAIWEAFQMLGRKDAVFGPALDGGYWLIGLKRVGAIPSGLFRNVRWSTRFALNDTQASLGNCNIGYVRTLRDIDTLDDLIMTPSDARVSSME